MNQKSTSEEQRDELSWEEAVSRYLEENPDYFLRHPDVVARLELAHQVGGEAISLIERQIQVLRERNALLQGQLRDLVAIARDNDALGERLHRFALAMIDSVSSDDVLDAAYGILRQEFKLDAVTVLVKAGPGIAGTRREFVEPDDKHINRMLKTLAGGKPVCGGKHDSDLLCYLFGDRAVRIKSCALIPLAERNPHGVLCLGSHDPRRFHPGMGTVYLAKLGAILVHALARYV